MSTSNDKPAYNPLFSQIQITLIRLPLMPTSSICCQFCYQCHQKASNLLKLQCLHRICVPCLRTSLLPADPLRPNRSSTQSHICQICHHKTQIELDQLHIDTYDSPPKPNHKPKQTSNMLVCIDCLGKAFTVEDYVDLKAHQGHTVETVNKFYEKAASILEDTHYRLKDQIELGFNQKVKVLHRKKLFNDEHKGTLMKIHNQFLHLRENLELKEKEIEAEYNQEANLYNEELADLLAVKERSIVQLELFESRVGSCLSQRHNSVEGKVGFFLSTVPQIQRYLKQLQMDSKPVDCQEKLKQSELTKKFSLRVDVEPLKTLLHQIRTLAVIKGKHEDKLATVTTISSEYFSKAKQSIEKDQMLDSFFQKLELTSASSSFRSDQMPQKFSNLRSQLKLQRPYLPN